LWLEDDRRVLIPPGKGRENILPIGRPFEGEFSHYIIGWICGGFFAEFYGRDQSSHKHPSHEVKKLNHGRTRRRKPDGRGNGGSASWIGET